MLYSTSFTLKNHNSIIYFKLKHLIIEKNSIQVTFSFKNLVGEGHMPHIYDFEKAGTNVLSAREKNLSDIQSHFLGLLNRVKADFYYKEGKSLY